MRILLVCTVLAIQAAQAPPDTEVYVAPLTIAGGTVTIGKPVNISKNTGYDNQPSFTPDGNAVLFTSVRGGRKPDPANGAATGSDIYRYDLATGTLRQLTDTPESEYSPTVTPEGSHISVIRVEADGTQRLWRFGVDGKPAEVVLADVKPVGYHAWADANTLALFVLGKPATLQVADVRTGKADVVAKGIGRSIQRMPGGNISFVLREAGAEGQPPALTICELVAGTRHTRVLIRVPPGATEADTAWSPDGLLLLSSREQLLGWRRGESEWKPIATFDSLGLRGVTRLAVSDRRAGWSVDDVSLSGMCLAPYPTLEVPMGLRDTYAYAIQTAKGKFDGSAQERDGKLHFVGSVKSEADANEIWNAIKTIPTWREDIVADIKVVAPAGAAAAGSSARTYTVKAGDTLSGIAKAQMGNANAYMQIFEANRDQLSDPDKIKPGQVLKLP